MRAARTALVSVIVAGCNAVPGVDRRIDDAAGAAIAHGFIAERVAAGSFELQAYHRGLDREGDHWHVYFEGDGQAYTSRTRLSPDPTPIDPVGLDLALADPAPAVLYLGRPCQYGQADDGDACPSRYWSSHRFAEDVVVAMLDAVDRLVKRHGDDPIDVTLIGYSGGGAIAALMASRSKRISRLVTVAAPLDLSAWTEHHGVSPLDGSLDPKAIAAELTMPQLHLSGGQDQVVPPASQNAFIAALSSSAPSQRRVISDFDHSCCWLRDWTMLLSTLPPVQTSLCNPAQALLSAGLPSATNQ